MIEGQVTLLAMEHLNADDFRTLRKLTEDCEKSFTIRSSASIRNAIELNHAFHNHIYRASGSRVMIPVIESLWLQSGPYVRRSAFLHNEQQDPAGTHHHWELISALERRDGDAAVKALKNDISRAFNLIRAQLDLEEQQADVSHEG
jgi:DNA-binding GntR family transcriptional regulator